MTIGMRLKELRGKLSREEFAGKLGIHPQTLYRYEKDGRSIDAELIGKIVKAFNISSKWLIFGDGPMKETGEEINNSRSGTDREILFDVVETLEEVLKEMDRDLSPAKKAEVVCDLYELMLHDEEAAKKPAMILRLIKGAMVANE